MPIRDIFVTVTVLGLLPYCLMRPWIGILVWSWLGYMNPHKLSWGFARGLPFAQMVAIATLAGLVVSRDNENRPIPWVRETCLLFALWVVYTITSFTAFYPDEAWPKWVEVSKILLFTFLTMKLFQTRERIDFLFLVVAMSLGFFGFKGGIWSLFIDFGVNQVQGPEGTFIGGNTEIGLALNMILPFLLYLARNETRPGLRRLLRAMFGFSVIGVIFTYSRGAFLGLVVVLMMLFLRGRRRVLGIVAIATLAVFVNTFAPEQWFGRMQSMENYQQDQSANMRLTAWQVAWRLALEHPLTGGGFWVLPHREIFARYAPDSTFENNAHSIYFATLGDHGFPGLILFVSLIVSCLWSLRRLRVTLRRVPEAKWLSDYCEMLEASLMAYAVSGAFLEQAYFDLFYHLVSFVILMRVIAVREGFVTAALTLSQKANLLPLTGTMAPLGTGEALSRRT